MAKSAVERLEDTLKGHRTLRDEDVLAAFVEMQARIAELERLVAKLQEARA